MNNFHTIAHWFPPWLGQTKILWFFLLFFALLQQYKFASIILSFQYKRLQIMVHQKSPVVIVAKQDHIVYLTLNRPDVLNALSFEVLTALKEELEKIRQDDTVQGVFIRGAGEKAFSAGADIAFFHTASPLEIRELARLAISVNELLENLGKVSIALINGFALGGGLELAESCMLRIAVAPARLGHPEVKLGVVAGWGGTTRLPRLIGKGRAAELLLTGGMVSARKAFEMGLVNLVTEKDTLQTEGERLMGEILGNGPVAVKFSWEAMHRGLNLSIEESTKLGGDYFGLIATTEDFRTGTGAFLTKKSPVFRGR
jgi:enoyl-CoA hydratase